MTSTRTAGLGWSVPVFAAAGLAWLITADRMDGMDAGPGTELGGLGWFVGVWVVMMAAMMLPSIVPIVLTYSRIRSTPLGTTIFVGGYLLVWTVVGLLAYAVVEEVRSLDIGFLAWDDAGRFVAAGVLLAAA